MPQWAQAIGGTIISVLFAGNLWFAARAVNKLDKMEETFWQLAQKVVVLETTLNNSSCKCFKNKGG